MSYLDEVNAVQISSDLMVRAHELVLARRDEAIAEGDAPDATASFLAIVQGLPGEVDRQVLVAIAFRMMALARLVESGALGQWTLGPTEDQQGTIISEALLRASAKAELREKGDQANFDAAEVAALALSFSEGEGRA